MHKLKTRSTVEDANAYLKEHEKRNYEKTQKLLEAQINKKIVRQGLGQSGTDVFGDQQYQYPIETAAQSPLGKLIEDQSKYKFGSKEYQAFDAEIEKLKATDPQSYTQIEGGIVGKWLENKPLSPKEQEIVDKRIKKTGQTPEQVKANAKARIEAKAESFKDLLGRDPSDEEKRAILLNDPFGFLSPPEEEEYAVGDEIEKNGKNYKYLGDNKWQKL